MLRMLAAVMAAAAPAAAQDLAEAQAPAAARPTLQDMQPMDAIAPQDMLLLLDSMDIDARLTALPAARDARTHSLGVTANTDGLYWDVVFYNCRGGVSLLPGQDSPEGGRRSQRACRDFAMSAAFDLEYPVSVQTINRFNREYRFARAVLAEDGAPMIEMDVNLEGGVTREALVVELDSWRALLLAFSRYVGY